MHYITASVLIDPITNLTYAQPIPQVSWRFLLYIKQNYIY